MSPDIGSLVAAAVVTAIVNGAVTLTVTVYAIKWQLRDLRRETTRAHRRLDLIRAPNVTLEHD